MTTYKLKALEWWCRANEAGEHVAYKANTLDGCYLEILYDAFLNGWVLSLKKNEDESPAKMLYEFCINKVEAFAFSNAYHKKQVSKYVRPWVYEARV